MENIEIRGQTYVGMDTVSIPKADGSGDAEFVLPEGEEKITENGEYDVTRKKTARVNVTASGTDNYNALSNKPSINGNTLEGNKTPAQLGLVAAQQGAGLITDEERQQIQTNADDIAEAQGEIRQQGSDLQQLQTTAENALAVAQEALQKAEEGGVGLSDDVKQALLQLAEKVAYSDTQGQTYYDDLYNAFYHPADLVSISATFNQGNTVVYDTASLDSLKPMLTVTAHYDDGSTASVGGYTLSGSLTAGTSTITVAYQGKTATFTVTVTERPATLTSITAAFTQGSATIYDTDSIDTLKQYLVVTAHYDDGSTAVVTDYALSGTLTEGTSTITVSYGEKTDTFDVTVTHQNDTTVEIATEGYVWWSIGAQQRTENGGITVKYNLDSPTTVLHPAGIIPTLFSSLHMIGNLCIYKNDEFVNYVSEYESDSAGRWGQLASGELAEYNSKSWNVAEYNQISFSVDLRCIDDAYMYDYTSGQVWFAGKNTPYYGKTNISEVVT